MALFPSSPTNGQTATVNGIIYTYSSSQTAWVRTGTPSGGSSTTVTTSDTAPVSPSNGDLWWNSSNGILYIYYDDGTSSQWVSSTSVLPGSGGGGDGTPGGSNTQIQFNDSGSFGGSANLTFNSSTGILAVNGNITAANITANTGVFTGNGSGLTNLNASNMTTGIVPSTRLGTGTPNANTYLRGDGTWQEVLSQINIDGGNATSIPVSDVVLDGGNA